MENLYETPNQTSTATMEAVMEAVDVASITQKDLRNFIQLRNDVKKMTKELEDQTENFKKLLKAGFTVENGRHIAELKETSRRSPKWQEEAVALAEKVFGLGQGEIWKKEVTDLTPAVKGWSLKVE
jgi:hypothetical protein